MKNPIVPPHPIRLCLVVLIAGAAASIGAHAQQSSHIQTSQEMPSMPDASGSLASPGSRDTDQLHMLKDMSKQRNVLRQQQIVDDTKQLLDLARQLKDAVDKSSKDQLSLEVVNTASEIEKLAKTVKEKMRDGQ